MRRLQGLVIPPTTLVCVVYHRRRYAYDANVLGEPSTWGDLFSRLYYRSWSVELRPERPAQIGYKRVYTGGTHG